MIQSSSDIEFVGMENIEGLINVKHTIPVLANVYVNLSRRRGIHMSRLYRVLMDELFEKKLSWQSSFELMRALILSQQDGSFAESSQTANSSQKVNSISAANSEQKINPNSENAKLQISGRWTKKQTSLVTGLKGLRQYPFRMQWFYSLKKPDDLKIQIRLRLLYSSTCPMSLALSEEVWKQDDVATPHAQRSQAIVVLNLNWKQIKKNKITISEYMDQVIEKLESVLKTPVQTSVKRLDEQEFARLNGKNPMFCEDAVRLLNQEISNWSELQSFQIKVRHMESLHPFDAVAMVRKNKS